MHFYQFGNASKDGYAKANRYEVVIGLPSGATQASVEHYGCNATAVKQLLSGDVCKDVSHFVVIRYQSQAEH